MHGYAGLAARAEATRHAQLLIECEGSLAIAAWHLARARNSETGYGEPTPSPTDLRSAAASISSSVAIALPPTETLVADARAAGLEVIG